MKKLIILMIALISANPLFSQRSSIDSLLMRLQRTESGKNRVDALVDLAHRYAYTDTDVSALYADSAFQESTEIQYLEGQAQALNAAAVRFAVLGLHSESLKKLYETIRIYDLLENELGIGKTYTNMGGLHIKMKDYEKAEEILKKSIALLEQPHLKIEPSYSYVMLGEVYQKSGVKDSSIYYYNKALEILSRVEDKDAIAYVKVGLAKNFLYQKPEKARNLIIEAIEAHEYFQDNSALAKAHLLLGQSYFASNRANHQALSNFLTSLKYAELVGSLVETSEAHESLSQWYEENDQANLALESYKNFKRIEDDIASNQLLTELTSLDWDFKQYQNEKMVELERAKEEKEVLTKNLLYSIISAFVFFVGFLSVAYVQKSKVNKELNNQNILIAEQKAEVEREKNNALQASQAKAKFLAAMSHEIRTPLNAIVGFSNLLISGDQKNRHEDLNSLRYSAENLLSLTNNLLDFSRMDSGDIQLEKIEFSIHNLVGSVCNQFKASALAKGLNCCMSYDENIPESVLGDPTRLGQILTNLVSNAIKFTEQGEVGLSVDLLESNSETVKLQFSVSDTGIGISEENQEAIFDHFTQGEAGVFRRYGGSGLGLAIVKRLTEAMGGDIKVESIVNEGSLFALNVELEVPRSLGLEDNDSKEQERQRLCLNGLRVLMVEDNEMNRLVGERFLQRWGVEVEHAENGLEGLKKLESKAYDLVLMDLEMPVMNGYDAIRSIRNDPNAVLSNIPIIALTATVTKEVKSDVIKLGVNELVSKPFDPDRLHHVMLENSPSWIKSTATV